ncbi:MAG: DUF3857 domain-containing protein [Bacteroidales bacterium]|nr:DUF3857 domain-containing protein [Bacteroidales bacterium]
MLKINLLKNTLLFIVLIQFSLLGYSQKSPMKFGKIDIEDLKMTVYDKDTTAEAVILCDYGVFSPERIEFTRHCRIKILKKEGANWANNRVRSFNKIILKARTYNLMNGEIEVTKMKNESKYEEYVNGKLFATRFSLANVREGSVIEYQYTIPWIPYEWRFQQEIPVIWSELRMEQNEYVKFQKNFFGYERLSIIENSRWVAKDMPAFRKEPYMNSITNYLTKFEFDVRKISIPGRHYKEFTTSWEEVSEKLLDNENFGVRLRSAFFLNKEAKKINELNLSDIEKAKKAFELVKNEITWDEINWKYAYSTLNHVFNKKKSGNSAEINLILVALLDKIGLEVKPVVLSTRNNGLLSPIFPTLNKLNYVIARVKIDEKYFLLDATDKLAPFGLLPKRCINGKGRLVDKNSSVWINLETSTKSKKIIFFNLSLSNDGEIKGNISYKLSDYAAYDFRKLLEEYTSNDEYIKYKESRYAGMNINDYDFENIDDVNKPVIAKYEISLQNNADIIGDNIYINPMFCEKMDDNPFKIEERKYPVDFIHPIEKSYILNLSIPDGYSVYQLPEPVKVVLLNNKGSFMYSINNSGQNIQLTYKFNINNALILPTEYNHLKQFYDYIINKHSEMIILKKNEG